MAVCALVSGRTDQASPNADIQVLLIMVVLSLAFVCIPFLPGVRRLPRRIPIYRLIWREHYRAEQSDVAPMIAVGATRDRGAQPTQLRTT